jgi:Sulfotransferase family
MRPGFLARLSRYREAVGSSNTGKSPHVDRPIFVWGAPCSGTSLLHPLVAKHPDVGFPKNEAQHPSEGTYIWWRAFGTHLGVMDASLVRARRVEQVRADYASILKTQEKPRLVDKSPFMTLWVPLINVVFPDARHFHIVRDGRAAVNSVLHKLRYSTMQRHKPYQEGRYMFGPYPPELADPLRQPQAQRHTRQWMQLVTHGRRNKDLLGDRYFEVRYEELVDDPRRIMRQVWDHAQLDHTEQLLLETFPPKLTNRNYKWQTLHQPMEQSDGYADRRSLSDEDMPYLTEMIPMLRSLGYQWDEPGP